MRRFGLVFAIFTFLIVAPTPERSITAEQLADPVFPDWLDPELNDERPDGEFLADQAFSNPYLASTA